MTFKDNLAFSKYLVGTIKKYFLATLFFLIITNVMSFVTPLMTKVVIDDLFFKQTTQNVVAVVFYYALVIIVSKTAVAIERNLSALQEEKLNETFRKNFIRTLFGKSLEEFSKINYGHIETVFNNNLSTINNSLYCITEILIASPLGLVIGLIFIISITPTLLLFLLAEIVLMFLSINYITTARVKSYGEQLLSQNRLYNHLEKAFNMFENIRMNFLSSYALNKFNQKSQTYASKNMKYHRVEILASYLFDMIEVLFEIATIVYFFTLIKNEQATPGDYFAFMLMKSYFVGAFNGFAQTKVRYKELSVAYSNIDSIISLKSLVSEDVQSGSIYDKPIKSISLSKVKFQYAKQKFQYEFDYTFKRGNVYLVFGENGIGKTTLIRLLVGLCKPQSGEIIINDYLPLKQLEQDILYQKIKVLPQRTSLFDDSLLKNIWPYDQDTNLDDTFFETAKRLDFDRVISLYENGLHSNVFDNGRILSGGQKKRIALMHMLANKPDVLIFDEPFSELDTPTRESLRKHLLEISKDKIILIITHDYSWPFAENEKKLILRELGDGKIRLQEMD